MGEVRNTSPDEGGWERVDFCVCFEDPATKLCNTQLKHLGLARGKK